MIVTTHRIAGITFQTESDVWLPRLREGVYAPFRIADEAVSDVHHRIHRISNDALSLPALVAEEQAQLARVVHVGAPEAWNSPLLRSSVIRSRLHEGLAQPGQMEALVNNDMVFVRDLAQRVIDFFYSQEYGLGTGITDRREGETVGRPCECTISSGIPYPPCP